MISKHNTGFLDPLVLDITSSPSNDDPTLKNRLLLRTLEDLAVDECDEDDDDDDDDHEDDDKDNDDGIMFAFFGLILRNKVWISLDLEFFLVLGLSSP